MIRDLILSVVVPLRDQRRAIGPFLDRLIRVLEEGFANYEVVVVDDGSIDGGAEVVRVLVARRPSLRLIVLSRRYGNPIAVTAGLDQAIGDYVAVVSEDLHDPVEMLPRLVERAREGVDVVYVRANRPSPGQGRTARLAAHLFYVLARRLTALDIHEDASDFQLLSRRVVNSLTRLKEHNRVMGMLVAYVGYTTEGIDPAPGLERPVRHWPGFRQRLHSAIDALVAFSDRPIRYVSAFSVAIASLALLGVVGVVVERTLNADLPAGWASLMVVLLVMFCLLFLLLAVVSEYVSRILTEAKHRPLYYVRDEVGGTRLSIENIVDVR